MTGVFDPEGPPPAKDRDEDGETVSKASRPPVRRAATLILIDRTPHGPKVLMGRRGKGHVFMPDKWVFPGGRAERADAFAPAASELSPEVTRILAAARPATGPRTLRGLAQAAIRELREEAGLRLEAPNASGRPLPDLAALELIGRAITPPYRVRRFDALFFTAPAERLLHHDRGEGDGELDEIAWFTLPEALALDLPNVTSFMLKELAKRMEQAGRPPLYLRYMRRKHSVSEMGA